MVRPSQYALYKGDELLALGTMKEIAKELKITAVALLDDLNKARQYFAPYAATWYAQQQEKEEN
jgi:predicted DNA-binding protein YlxM (UPF0122 family)